MYPPAPPQTWRERLPTFPILRTTIIAAAQSSSAPNTRPDTIHLVEASTELFSSASGKSGGFVAEDWFGPATASLGELSFRLHKELAEEFGGRDQWGYSRSTGTSLVDGGDGVEGGDWLAEGGSRAQASGVHEYTGHDTGPSWLKRRKGDTVESLSEPGGVAQVDPLRLCRFLLKQSILQGVRLHHPARAVKVARDTEGNLSGLRVKHSNGSQFKIPCTRLLITAGAWTPRVFDDLFPYASLSIPVTPLAGHSLVVRSPRWTSQHEEEAKGCHAVFTTMSEGRGTFSPEIFSRVGGEIYIAGLNSDSITLPESPEKAVVDEAAVEELKRVAEIFLGQDGTDVSDLEVVREGLCFRPVTRRGVPILTKVSDESLNAAGVGDGGIRTLGSPDGGVYVCAGHGPWGISLGLGTGKVLSELLEGEKLSADVRSLGME
ncbi:hypothetical protein M409DRAFT_53724 [Zasmidium cellare ATCC 36951]|uniref:FAD dependent oxidoreductase domain-containing protein n=1 Tax=Zasmidium cellare ATCC 36951 TaxID=1080233 RepID=A0A6A6CMA9_ZASCE|nr:uncharacterized protein M409DRAFT_53724 [Zasmidium cellare ATCC 36951]KAF2167753.1 hypothetical protein M409DRAFT_53724 [Zasmidium cellare ATCC 36951]